MCRCRKGYWRADGSGWVSGAALRAQAAEPGAAPAWLSCAACAAESDAAACLGDSYRVALIAANLAGMLLCHVIAAIVFRKRKCKVCTLLNCDFCSFWY